MQEGGTESKYIPTYNLKTFKYVYRLIDVLFFIKTFKYVYS